MKKFGVAGASIPGTLRAFNDEHLDSGQPGD